MGRCTICTLHIYTSNYCYHLGVPVASLEPPRKATKRGGRVQTLQAEIEEAFATGRFDTEAWVQFAMHPSKLYTTPLAEDRLQFMDDYSQLGADPPVNHGSVQ